MGSRGPQPSGRALSQVERNRLWRAKKAALALLQQPPQDDSWRGQAACKDKPGHLFFTDQHIYEAKAICSTCPVKPQCAIAGAHEHHGVWGGLTPLERHKRLREPA